MHLLSISTSQLLIKVFLSLKFLLTPLLSDTKRIYRCLKAVLSLMINFQNMYAESCFHLATLKQYFSNGSFFNEMPYYCKLSSVITTGASPAGGRGAMLPRFSFLPPRFISCPPQGIFWGGKSCCYWPEKTFEFLILARKSLRISAKTFFRFWRSPDFH